MAFPQQGGYPQQQGGFPQQQVPQQVPQPGGYPQQQQPGGFPQQGQQPMQQPQPGYQQMPVNQPQQGGFPQQGGYPQQQPMQNGFPQNQVQQTFAPQQQPAQGLQPAMNLWGTSSGGGGLTEFIFTVESCQGTTNKKDASKTNFTWLGKRHDGKEHTQNWGYGKNWAWNPMTKEMCNPQNAEAQVNENTTFGMFLRCLVEGIPYDLRQFAQMVCGRGSPHAASTWTGVRLHMCRIPMDFGSGRGPSPMLWVVGIYGHASEPMPAFNWLTEGHTEAGANAVRAREPKPAYNPQQGQPQQGQPQQNGFPQQGQQPNQQQQPMNNGGQFAGNGQGFPGGSQQPQQQWG